MEGRSDSLHSLNPVARIPVKLLIAHGATSSRRVGFVLVCGCRVKTNKHDDRQTNGQTLETLGEKKEKEICVLRLRLGVRACIEVMAVLAWHYLLN